MLIRRPLVTAVALLVGLICCRPRYASAAIAGAEDPKAATNHDLLRSKLDFNRRTLAGAYQSVGKRDVKWDGPATKLLDAMAVYFSYAGEEPIYRTVEVPTREALRALGQTAADAGCDDPLVTYCRGAALEDAGEFAAALPLVEQAVAGLVQRKYPPNRIQGAAQRAMRLLANTPGDPAAALAKGKRYEQTSWDAALAMADAQPANDLRPTLVGIGSFYGTLTLDRQRAFAEALESRTTADPWFVNLYRGYYEVQAAWKSRGSDWAGKVTDAGWQGFFEHLALARDHLAKAHGLHPDFPDAACEMIAVAMGAGERLNTTTREWFDKATKAQIDFYPAYDSYAYSLLPRWGGDYQRMFQLGVECARTNRYDTYVPYQLMHIVQRINRDSSNDFAIFKAPQVQAALRQMIAKTAEAARSPERRDAYLSLLLALEWRNGKYQAAADLADKLESRVDSGMMEELGAWGPEAVSQSRALVTPQARTIAQAERSAADGDWNAALVAYNRVAEALGRDHPAQFYVRYRAKALEMQRDFGQGKDVSLAPDTDLAPWGVIRGDWKLEKDGIITATADWRGQAVLICRVAFGPAYELEARLGPPDPANPSAPTLLANWRDVGHYSAGGIDAAAGTAYIVAATFNPRPPVQLKGGELLTIRVTGDRISLLFDGKIVIENQPIYAAQPGQSPFVGLAINGRSPGRKAQFSDVKIRRIQPSPPK